MLYRHDLFILVSYIVKNFLNAGLFQVQQLVGSLVKGNIIVTK